MKRIKIFIGVVLFAAVTMFAAGCEEDNAEPTNVSDSTATEYWVDLGLPSGLLWATRNVGASSPEDYGGYFAWGETTPKSDYSWETYRYANGNHAITKYCNKSGYGYNGFIDNRTSLTNDDDAASVNVTGSRMPTHDEWVELVNNTTSQWTSVNGINGRVFTAPNGNTLFLPAAGARWDDETRGVGYRGYYWSSSLSSLYGGIPCDARNLYFNSDGVYRSNSNRYGGFPVRPVRSVRSVRPVR